MSLKDVLDAGINPALISMRAFGPARVWRIYPSAHGPDVYNGTRNGDARFLPLGRADGSVVASLYAGTDLEVALMEVVLRELAIGCAGEQFMLPNRKKEWRRATQLDLAVPLQLADLSNRRFAPGACSARTRSIARRPTTSRRDASDCGSTRTRRRRRASSGHHGSSIAARRWFFSATESIPQRSR